MKEVSSRAFFRNPYQHLKELPIVVTLRGKPTFVVTRIGGKVVTDAEPYELAQMAHDAAKEREAEKQEAVRYCKHGFPRDLCKECGLKGRRLK